VLRYTRGILLSQETTVTARKQTIPEIRKTF
jgi:hypothetical protein